MKVGYESDFVNVKAKFKGYLLNRWQAKILFIQ